MQSSEFKAIYKNAKISFKKAALSADLIRGCNAIEAQRRLEFNNTKASQLFSKLLKSAISNASIKGSDASDLYVSFASAQMGRTFRRARIVARSRVNPIIKRYAHLYVGLSKNAVVAPKVSVAPKKVKTQKVAPVKSAKPVAKRATKKVETKEIGGTDGK